MVEEGLPCFVCGEPTWSTFEEMARREGKSESEIDLLVEAMKSRYAMKSLKETS
jgi:predicted nucleotidyltransferase